MSAGPYRGGHASRWVCLVCYGHLSELAGLCPRCEVDLLSLDDPEVRAELRAEAERRLQKRMYGEYFGLSLLGFVFAIPTLPFVGELAYVAAALGAGWVSMRAYARARPRSALGLYADRRRRLRSELAGNPPQPQLPAPKAGPEEGDPEDMDVEGTLRWLGLVEADKR